ERRNKDEVFTVAGVVGNIRSGSPEHEPPLMVYVPFAQQPLNEMTVVVRTAAGIPAIRQVVAAVDKSIPVSGIRKAGELVDDALAGRRFQMTLLTSFAGVALLLAAIGIYGVVSASVAERR